MDLHCTMPVTFAEAALGGVLSVPTLDGAAKLKLPAGTTGGTIFRVRGKGMPSLKSSSHGDLMVEIQVETPSELSSAQKKALEAFTSTLKAANQPEATAFLNKAAKYMK